MIFVHVHLHIVAVLNEISDQILINSNRDRYMTVVRSTASGDCITDSDDRISVVFGQNVRTGCMLRYAPPLFLNGKVIIL